MDHASLRRVAIVLDSLDRETASRLLDKMPPPRARLVRNAINQLQDVDPLERKTAIADFMQKSHTDHSQPSADLDLEQPTHGKDSFFSSLPIETLIEFLANEHPQTIAIVLASMEASLAANLIKRLPPKLRSESLSRLARLGEIPQDALSEIRNHIQLKTIDSLQSDVTPGSHSLTEILNHVDASNRGEMLVELSKRDPVLAMKIPLSMRTPSQAASPPQLTSVEPTSKKRSSPAQPKDPGVNFSEIESLPADALRRVLANVDIDSAILSLCGMNPRTVQRLLAELPKQQRQEVVDRLKTVENRRLSDIDHAQTRVLGVAITMMRRGELPELSRAGQGNQINLAA